MRFLCSPHPQKPLTEKPGNFVIPHSENADPGSRTSPWTNGKPDS